MGNGLIFRGEKSQVPDPFSGNRFAVHGLSEGEKRASTLDLAAMVRILLEWRWLVLGAIALGLAVAVISTLLTTPMYRASGTLEVNPPSVEILDEKQREATTTNGWDYIATQVGLLSSRSLAERVAQDLGLANDNEFLGAEGDAATRLKIATERVADGLKVNSPEEGNLIRFSYSSDSPTRAAQIANGIAEAFINSGLQRRYEATAYARNFLQKQIGKARADLERTERELVNYAQAQGIINTSAGKDGQASGDTSSLQGESLIALNAALSEATAKRLQAEGAYQQAKLAGGTAEVNESTSALRQAKAGLEAEYQDKRTLMKPEHPEMLSLRSRIEELDRQIGRERSQVASGRVTTLLSEYRAAASAESALRSRVAQLRGSVLDLRGRSIRYTILQRDVDTNRALYDALLQRYKEVGVGGGVGSSPVSIVDWAEVPGKPYKPNLMLNLLIGLFAGLAAGVVAALALEVLNDTIKTREDVANKLGLACLGVIPIQQSKRPVLEDLEDLASPMSEGYSAVLATLRFSAETGAPKTLLMTSSRPGEGKSTSALALAQNYARRGETVLLIDADLRRPAFRGVGKTGGLIKLLTSDESIRAHIIDTNYDNLWLLPCGPIAPNPADLLATGRFAEIVESAGSLFDRIIIDGPPVLGLADAPFLASVADGTMVVVEAGKTRTAVARQAIDRIKSVGARIVGVTLTKSKSEASHYGYRNYQYGGVEDQRREVILITQGAPS